ncbi:MAG: BrnT family toxin [Thiobacillus sp.]|nr:BrnT family toxin [Thiobacillus sp.]
MIDFSIVTGFDWDVGNTRKNADSHDVSQAVAAQVFFNQPLIVTPDEKHSEGEQRVRAMGMTNTGRLLTIIFTMRADGELIRVISARDMHRKERKEYEQAT